jgi:DNA invertase Pin-like site-specific DNA recombinase
MQLVGYARVSTPEQSLHLQTDALKKAGCARIFTEVVSGAKSARPGLSEALDYARPGDTLVVWKLDRLGRSLPDLIVHVQQLADKNIGFKSLQEQIDTTTSSGKFTFHLFSALAEFERDIIRERTQAGLKAARARGRTGGRPHLLNAKQIALLKRMHADTANSITEICRSLSISRSTAYRYLKKE